MSSAKTSHLKRISAQSLIVASEAVVTDRPARSLRRLPCLRVIARQKNDTQGCPGLASECPEIKKASKSAKETGGRAPTLGTGPGPPAAASHPGSQGCVPEP